MKHFFRGGRGLSSRQSDHVIQLASYHVLSSRPIERNNRLLHFVRNDGTGRSDGTTGKDRGSLSTTFVQASPLLRPCITHSSPFQYLFNTSASRILDQNVMKTCSESDETPKQVRSRCGSGQAPVGSQDYRLSSAQVLPLFYFGSTKTGSIPNGSPMNPRSPSGVDREWIGSSSEKGRTWLGPGRCQGGTFSAYWWLIGCSFFDVEASTDQGIGKEQADKYQAKPKPSPKKEQRIGKEQAENKQRSSVPNSGFLRPFFGRHLTAALPPPYRGLTAALHLVRPQYDFSKAEVRKQWEKEHTWGILREYTKGASARVAGWFGMASRLGRTMVQTGSTVVRPLFESCSSASRSPVEGESNSTRRCVEEVSNTSRSAVEGQSKSFRTVVEADGGGTKVELALTQPITRVELGMNYQTTKDVLGSIHNPSKSFIILQNHSEGAEVPERYCKGTGEVLNSGGKGTEEVLESYQRGTKDLHVDGKSVIALGRDVNTSSRHRDWNAMERSDLLDRLLRQARSDVNRSRNDEEVVDDLREKRLILKGFWELCEEFRVKVKSVLVEQKIKRDKGLKQVIRFAKFLDIRSESPSGFSIPLRYSRYDGREKRGDVRSVWCMQLGKGYQLLALIIFCVLFSNPDLLGARALAQTPQQRDTSRLSRESGTNVGDSSKQGGAGLVIGDSLPEWFWEQELQVVNHPYKFKTIRLSEFKDKLLVLDFLNTACSGCIKSVDKWNELQPEYRREVSVLPIHLYGDNARIAPFAKQRDWILPIAVGNKVDTVINQLFYVRYSFGQVWIKEGKLLAIPHNRDVSRTLIGKALTRRDLGITMNDMLTYFDHRYFIKEEE